MGLNTPTRKNVLLQRRSAESCKMNPISLHHKAVVLVCDTFSIRNYTNESITKCWGGKSFNRLYNQGQLLKLVMTKIFKIKKITSWQVHEIFAKQSSSYFCTEHKPQTLLQYCQLNSPVNVKTFYLAISED